MSSRKPWHYLGAVVVVAGLACSTGWALADETIRTGDGLLSLTASMPEETRAGEEFTYQVVVANNSDNVTLHDIELKQLKAAGFSVSSTEIKSPSKSKDSDSDKQATSEKDRKSSNGTMKISVLKPGESRTIQVKASADEEGELRSCLAIVNYMPALCLTSKVVKPQLELTKVAPEKADRCNVIELEYTVTNGGSGDVGPFMITDSLGKGLATIDGDESLKFEVNGLTAGDTRKFVARVFASKPGEFTSRAVATADNSDLKSRSKETTTNVIAADLKVEVDGPSRLYGGQLATFTARVTNSGNAPAEVVQVNVKWPESCNLVDFSQPTMQTAKSQSDTDSQSGDQPQPTAAKQKPADQAKAKTAKNKEQETEMAMSEKAITIERLNAGQTAVFEYAVRAEDVESLPTQVVARYICTVETGKNGADAKNETVSTAFARTELVRLPALQMIVIDDQDPVSSGDEVVYTIRVWNEGDANDSNLKLTAELPEGLKFVSANGPTADSVDGSKVTFKPITTLRPGDRADFKVTAKATGNGDVRFIANLTSKSLSKKVTGEEPTRLFSKNAESK